MTMEGGSVDMDSASEPHMEEDNLEETSIPHVGVPETPTEAGKMWNRFDDSLPPPRLMITQMVLENFKSYAGQQVIGPFHKNFAAVVGPNGSGKSNVIDALLFVFGKRAKQLRLNKVKELIHKSSSYTGLTSATVSVHFCEIQDTGPGDDEYVVVEGSECVISRVARSDNTSTYKLNGKNCQFKDVATILKSKGIDLDHNRFLILQGEVELISMMPPKAPKEGDDGLLEYLEDIIGSNKFVEQTNEVMAQVEQLSEQRNGHLQRVKALQAELQGLEGAKQEAEALLAKEREIRRKQNILYQLNLEASCQSIEQRTAKVEELHDQLVQEREQMAATAERMRELESGLAAQQSEYDAVYSELQKAKDDFTAFERQDIQLKEERKHLQANRKKLAAKIESEQGKQSELAAKIEQAKENIPKLESKIEELVAEQEQQSAKLEEILEERKEVTQVLRARLETKQAELAPVRDQRNEFQNRLDTASTEVELLESSTKSAQERLDKAKSELEQLGAKEESVRTQLASSQDDLQQAKDSLVEAEREDGDLAQKEVQLAARYRECMSLSEEAKASLQSRGNVRSPSVRAILEATKPGGELCNAGVLGRLGDLGTISEAYDVAISTACGMLDHIVVKETKGAQRCIDFLRRHNAGRANFVALEKLKKGAHDALPATPEGAPLLFSLIQPKNHAVVPALFLGVGHTLVAPDLETATRWAYEYGKRWRVVTLDGKLIERSGTMAGGGKSVQRGGMQLGSKRTASATEPDDDELDCQRLEQEAQRAESSLQQCRSRRKELVEVNRGLKKQIKSLESLIPKLTVELSGFGTTRRELSKLIPELEPQCHLNRSDAEKLASLVARVDECKVEMSSCAALAARLEAEVESLQSDIVQAGGPRLKKQQDAYDKVQKKLKDTEKALNVAKVSITSSEKSIGKSKDAQSAAEQELEECKANLEQKKAEREAIEVHALAVMQSFEKVKVEEAKKRAALDEATTEFELLGKQQSQTKVAEIEVAAKIENLEKQLEEFERKKAHWSNAIEKLKNDMSDGDEEDDLSVDGGDEGDAPNGDVKDMSDGEGESAAKDASKSIKSTLPIYSPTALAKFSVEQVKEDISILETERNTLAKNANMGAIAEYRKKNGDYLARVEELDNVTNERNAVRKSYDDLRRMRLEMFMDGFGRITLKLKQMYQMITLGGDAELELVDSLDPFSEGILFSVRPPKKSWKNISNLSGGEKTLSSLALVFALHHFKPTPLYVMDEIDAALDFKNVSIVANYIKERTKNAQFVIISLRNNMFELADRLVGIYKTNNCTKSVSINPKLFGVDCQQDGIVPTTPALGDTTNSRPIPLMDTSAVKSSRRRVSFHLSGEADLDQMEE